jgi:hypothetical protein
VLSNLVILVSNIQNYFVMLSNIFGRLHIHNLLAYVRFTEIDITTFGCQKWHPKHEVVSPTTTH